MLGVEFSVPLRYGKRRAGVLRWKTSRNIKKGIGMKNKASSWRYANFKVKTG
jgi:hypothetical protein